MEANERPIDLRHLQLAMMYYTKCHANDSNPARQPTENASHDVRFALQHRFIRPLRHRVQDHLENANIDMQIIYSAPNLLSPPPPFHLYLMSTSPHATFNRLPGAFSFLKLIQPLPRLAKNLQTPTTSASNSSSEECTISMQPLFTLMGRSVI